MFRVDPNNPLKTANPLCLLVPFLTPAATSRSPASSARCLIYLLLALGGPVPGHPPVLKPTRLSNSSQQTSESVGSGPNSGPMKKTSGSGPMVALQPTGLITSGPLGSSTGRRSGQPDPTGPSGKVVYGPAATSLSEEGKFGFKVSKVAMWVFLVIVLMGLVVGAVKKALILVMVVAVFVPVVIVFLWNLAWRKRGLLGFLSKYPNSELRRLLMDSMSRLLGLSPAEVFLLNHYSKKYQDVYMFLRNCMSIED